MPQWKGHPQQPPQPRQPLQWPLAQAGFSGRGGDGSLPLFTGASLPAALPLQLPPSRCSSQPGSSTQTRSSSQPGSHIAGATQLGSHPLDLDSQGFAQLRQHSLPAAAVPAHELEQPPPEQQQQQRWQQRQHSLPAMWLPPPAPQRHDDWNNCALGLPVPLSVRRESSGAAHAAASSIHLGQPVTCYQMNPALLTQQQQWWQHQQQEQQLHCQQQQLQHRHQSMHSSEMCTPNGAPLPELGLPPPLVTLNAAV